jgi:hypothetical protein
MLVPRISRGKPETPNSKPETPNPELQTRNHEPETPTRLIFDGAGFFCALQSGNLSFYKNTLIYSIKVSIFV